MQDCTDFSQDKEPKGSVAGSYANWRVTQQYGIRSAKTLQIRASGLLVVLQHAGEPSLNFRRTVYKRRLHF